MRVSASGINLKGDYNMKDLSHYAVLSDLFRYPEKDMCNLAWGWTEILNGYETTLVDRLTPFILHLEEKPLSYQQEYYVSTFDVQPICCLDIGYVLFGEEYRRGEFMVHIKKEQLSAGIDCGSELPDHLTNILTLLSRMKDEELAGELIYSLLIPALSQMILKFREKKNHYKDLLEILKTVMEKDYPSSSYEKFQFPDRTKKSGPEMQQSAEK